MRVLSSSSISMRSIYLRCEIASITPHPEMNETTKVVIMMTVATKVATKPCLVVFDRYPLSRNEKRP